MGGLVSLGLKPDDLKKELKKLNIPDFKIEVSDRNRSGINSVHVETICPEEKVHRHLSEIETIINNSELSNAVKSRSVRIFRSLAAAEAAVHGVDIDKVHFHEVGAMDAIIDVVGSCVGFEKLGIERFAGSKIHVGSGFIEIAHGRYPVPPPAVAELLKGIPIYSTEIEGELITPTGAAIVASVCSKFGEIPEMTLEKTGYGAGSREYDRFPNVLRLILGTVEEDKNGSFCESLLSYEQTSIIDSQKLILIETNLDDVSSEILGYVMEKAFEIGALDCWFTPIQMKKNRPATMISVLCEMSSRQILSEMLFLETTTLGIRISEVDRHCLPRDVEKVNTEFGEVELKIARYGKRIVNVKPEYEALKKAAKAAGLSIKEVETKIFRSFEKSTGDI